MDEGVANLAANLMEMARILDRYPETGAQRLRRWADWLRRGDGQGVIAFLDASHELGRIEDLGGRRYEDLLAQSVTLAQNLRHDAENAPSNDISER